MANNSNSDIFVLFGVEGGSSISSGSGELIYTTLKQIISNIEKAGLNVKINADVANKNELQKQIQDSLADLSNSTQSTPVPISVSISPESVISGIQSALDGHSFDIKLNAGDIHLNSLTKDAAPLSSGNNTPQNIRTTSKEIKVETGGGFIEAVQELGIAKDTAQQLQKGLKELSIKPYKIKLDFVSDDKTGNMVKRYFIEGKDAKGGSVRTQIKYNEKDKEYQLDKGSVEYNLEKAARQSERIEKANQRAEKSTTDLRVEYEKLVGTYNKWDKMYSTTQANWTNVSQEAKSKVETANALFNPTDGQTGGSIDEQRVAIAQLKRAIGELVPEVRKYDKEAKSAFKNSKEIIPEKTIKQINKLEEGLGSSNATLTRIKAIQDAINTGNYNNVDGVDNYNSAIELMNKLLIQAQKELSATTKETKALNKAEEQAAKTRAKASSVLNLYSELDERQYQSDPNLQSNISRLRSVYDAVKTNDPNYNWSALGIQGINSYREALRWLSEETDKVSANLREFKNNASNVTDEAAIAKLREYARVYREFLDAPGSNGMTELMNNQLYEQAMVALNFEPKEQANFARKNYTQITQAIGGLQTGVSQLNQKHVDEMNIVTQRNKIYQEAYNYYQKYQSGIKSNIALNRKWNDLMKQINTGAFKNDNESARRALAELQTETKNTNAEVMSLWGTLKKLFTDHFGSVSATAAIGVMRNVIYSAYQNVLDIDKAMTELRKVTELTEEQYKSFGNTAANMAQKVGSSMADAISSTADFARLGFDLTDSTSLAEAAMVYKNVGDGIEDINEASESIISTIKAFSDIDAEDALSIIDKFNEVGNNYAISSQGIGVALQKSAAALASANNSLDESIALITAGNSVVQNPEIIGGVNADVKSSYNG